MIFLLSLFLFSSVPPSTSPSPSVSSQTAPLRTTRRKSHFKGLLRSPPCCRRTEWNCAALFGKSYTRHKFSLASSLPTRPHPCSPSLSLFAGKKAREGDFFTRHSPNSHHESEKINVAAASIISPGCFCQDFRETRTCPGFNHSTLHRIAG